MILFQLLFYPPTCPGPQPGHTANVYDTVLFQTEDVSSELGSVGFNFRTDGHIFVYDTEAPKEIISVYEAFQERHPLR
jgi:hypothetical protein